MNIRKVDMNNEHIHLCALCEAISNSAECDSMFEVKGEANTLYICGDCLNEIHMGVLKISREMKKNL